MLFLRTTLSMLSSIARLTIFFMSTMYDLAIVGGGPAGVAAGVYASRKLLKTIFIAKEIGGQSVVSADVQNWIGIPSISGTDLAKNLETHLRAYADGYMDIKKDVTAEKLEKIEGGFRVTTSDGKTYEAKTVLITTGANRRQLNVPGAKEYDQKGLTYCASCDGPLFSDMDVAVIGGGNAGFESAAQLLAYTKTVTLLDRMPSFKAEQITVQKVLAHPNMKALSEVEIQEVKGDGMVTGLTYKDKAGELHELAVQGIFVEIGLVPSTAFAEGIVTLDEYKRVITDPRNQHTSQEGVWAAGDCTDVLYHQNNIAMGDAVKAIEDIYLYLRA